MILLKKIHQAAILTWKLPVLGKMGVFLLLAHVFQPTVCNAGTYYFSTSGNDANSGADPSAPKQSLAAAVDLALPGHTLLFKRGDAWYQPSAGAALLDLRNKSGRADNYIRIDAYGTGPKPVISNLARLDDAAWINREGTTVWQQTVSGYSDAWRLYVGESSRYKVNTSNPAANENDVDQPHEWFIKALVAGSSGVVYLDTGSTVNGPSSVEVHPVNSTSVVLMKDTHHVAICNIDFRGGSQYNVIHVEASSSHILFGENIIQKANGSGLVVANLLSGENEYVSDVVITHNLVDKVWSIQENDPDASLSGDGIFLMHAVDTGLIKGNIVRNWGHCGITLTSYRSGFHGVHRIVVEQNNVYSDSSAYMHAFDVSGYENLTTNNVVRRNVFHGYQATNHAQGNSNKFYSNIFYHATLTSMPKPPKQPWGLDMVTWRVAVADDGDYVVAQDNIVANNTFVKMERYAIVIGEAAGSNGTVKNNLIANNLICDYGPAFIGEVGLNVLPSTRGDIHVRNNNFWDFDPHAPAVRYKNPDSSENYTVAQLNAAFPQWCSGNVQLDPRFADVLRHDFRLTVQSPEAVKRGGMDLSSVMGEGFVDFDGNAWDASNPSMGAFQFRSN